MRKGTFVGTLCCGLNLLCIAAIVLVCVPGFAQDAATALPSDPKELMLLAAKVNSLTGPGMQPWRLKASLHTFTAATSLSEEENKQGKYEELWAGGDKFKQTYSDEEHSQTVYGTPNGKFIAGGLRFVLGEVHQLSEFFEPAAYLRQYAEGRNPEFDPADADAGESACVQTVSDRPKDSKREPLVYRFCFDSSLRLVRFSINGNDDFLILFRKPLSFNGRTTPTEVELRRHGIVLVLANLESLEAAEPIEESEFQPPADAVRDESNPPVSAAPSKVIVSNGVAAGMLLEHTPLLYPPIAKAARVQGTVVLQALLGKDGRVEELHVISGPPMLQQAAIDAVEQWVYKPYLLNRKPVEVETTVNVIFTLSDPPKSKQQQ
jgi:TonB family protein